MKKVLAVFILSLSCGQLVNAAPSIKANQDYCFELKDAVAASKETYLSLRTTKNLKSMNELGNIVNVSAEMYSATDEAPNPYRIIFLSGTAGLTNLTGLLGSPESVEISLNGVDNQTLDTSGLFTIGTILQFDDPKKVSTGKWQTILTGDANEVAKTYKISGDIVRLNCAVIKEKFGK